MGVYFHNSGVVFLGYVEGEVMFRPMLASKIDDLSKVQYPVMASPKLDGIRCLLIDGVAVSRSLKPIPNKFIRKHIERTKIDGMDGEIIIKGKTFSEISSAVMSEEGEPDFSFVTFDYTARGFDLPYIVRLNAVKEKVKEFPFLGVIRNTLVNNEEELLKLEQKFIAEGYEGLMFRKINGPYKQGRSTVKEGYLLKLKRFEDAEAEVIGYEELMHNDNVQETDELGYSNEKTDEILKAYGKEDCMTLSVRLGISFSTICRIWRAHGLKGKKFHNGKKL